MATTTSRPRTARGRVVGVVLATVVAGLVGSLANAAVSAIGIAAGADPALPGLTPAAYVTFTVVGVLAGAIGWALISRARGARRILTVLVPVMLVLSLIPDVAIGFGGGRATVIAAVALGVMHIVTVAIAVPTYRYFLPLDARS